MSVAPPNCPNGHGECVFEGVQAFPPGQESSYGVAWRCPACGTRTLDVCNLGPLVPTPSACLECGSEYPPGDDACPACGLSREGVRAFLRLPDAPAADSLQSAQGALRQGCFRHGLGLLNQLLQRDPSVSEAWDLKARFLQGVGFRASAEAMFRRALDSGGPTMLAVRLGSLLAARGACAEAVAAYQKVLDTSADPHTIAAVSSDQGNVLAALGDYPAAERAHQRAIAAAPANAPLYLNYADTLIKQRRWDDALRMIDGGLAQSPNAGDAIDLLEAKGHVECGQMRGEAALASVGRALALGSGSVKTHYIRGRALAMVGRLPEAKSAMEQVLRLDPNMTHARQAVEQIDAALRG